jgi:hypothetical protein
MWKLRDERMVISIAITITITMTMTMTMTMTITIITGRDGEADIIIAKPSSFR